MDRLTIATGEDPLVEMVVNGDLLVKGSDDLEVMVKTGSPDETVLEQQEDKLVLRCQADCKVYVPRQARLRLLELNGDGAIKAVEGELSVQKVNGSLELRSVGPVEIQEIDGNLEGKNILGDLSAKKVSGNLIVRDVQGDALLESVNGNLVLDDVDGSVTATAGGNATLSLDPAPGAEYTVTAKGNITCSLAADSSAEISIGRAGRIMINMPGAQPEMRNLTAPYTFTLGEGDASLNFMAEGNVILNSQAPDWHGMPDLEIGEEIGGAAEAFADQITHQIEVQMQMLEQQLNSTLANLDVTLGSAGLSTEQIERIQQRAREAGERASARAQEKLGRAQERLERKLAQAQRHAERQARYAEARARASAERVERRARMWHGPWGEHAGHPASPAEPVGDEERMVILRMLQEKKISLQEAESLLAALEGRESE